MKPYPIQSIRELHALLRLPKPRHPLISVINFAEIHCFDKPELESVYYGFYCIALKKNFHGQMRYGQQSYDFDDGVMTFFAPGQVVTTEIRDDWNLEGLWLVAHPDFLQGYALGKDIQQLHYFSYAVNEALHLSSQEEQIVTGLLEQLLQESEHVTDIYSQAIIIKQIELLLSYCDRFYHRQFLTRKQAGNGLLASFEQLLNAYFADDNAFSKGLPSVSYFARQLNLSANYLSDMLRITTGRSAQQYIQAKVIDQAQLMLGTTELSVSEIAYQLGFEYPQSFSKLFKNRTSQTPKQFRALITQTLKN